MESTRSNTAHAASLCARGRKSGANCGADRTADCSGALIDDDEVLVAAEFADAVVADGGKSADGGGGVDAATMSSSERIGLPLDDILVC